MTLDSSREFYIGLGRAAGGSILFTVPILMTMEMWWLGFYMDPFRLGLMLLVSVPILSGLAYHSGFQKRLSIYGAIVDAMVALAVGAAMAAAILVSLAIINGATSMQEAVGKITVQAIPGAIGAVLASSQMGNRKDDGDAKKKERERGFWGELFLMMAGALFFAFNMAPTEEMVVIAHRMSAWHSLILVVASIGIMHAFVYAVDFRGQHTRPEGHSWWAMFSRFTITGYILALGVSYYCLWSFGRNDGTDPFMILTQVIVLGFPAAIGAAAARLII